MGKILITGGGGFVGQNLIDFLLKETGYEVISIQRKPSTTHEKLKIIYHDLRSPISEKTSSEIGEVDYIIHLAASTCAKKSIDNPMNFVMDNIVGTVNLLEYARHNVKNLKQFLYFSTAEVFGSAPDGTIFKESDFPNPSSPYAATKISAQEFCISYKNAFGVPVVIAYAMNAFGPYQSLEKFIPLMIEKILKEKKIFIYSNGEGTAPHRRNYLHVEDLCGAILFLTECGISGEKYNIAAEEESDNLKLAQMISKILGKKLNYELVRQRQNSLTHPCLSGEKLQKLGWQQKKTLEEGLIELIKWTKREKIYDY